MMAQVPIQSALQKNTKAILDGEHLTPTPSIPLNPSHLVTQ